jgi:hypothetical protein
MIYFCTSLCLLPKSLLTWAYLYIFIVLSHFPSQSYILITLRMPVEWFLPSFVPCQKHHIVSCYREGFLIPIVILSFFYSHICEITTFSLKFYFSLFILFWYYHYLLYACPFPSQNAFSALSIHLLTVYLYIKCLSLTYSYFM